MNDKDQRQKGCIAPPQVHTAPPPPPDRGPRRIVDPAERGARVMNALVVDEHEPDASEDEDEDDFGEDIELSDEQQAVLDRVKRGQSIFFTGSAGTGKSVLLRAIIRWCRHIARLKTAVTASTGIAGYHIGGSTIHSWAGIGLGIGSAQKNVIKLRKRGNAENEKALKRLGNAFKENYEYHRPLRNWLRAEVLVLDEISMISGYLFGKLEKMARLLRGNELPFGGIQLVLAGDFYQLPPVHKAGRERPPLAFESWHWNKCVGPPIILTQVFRQKEPELIDMLNSVRLARVTPTVTNLFTRLSRKLDPDDDVEPIDIYPLRKDVEAENHRRLGFLEGDGHDYPAVDSGGRDSTGLPYESDVVKMHLKDIPAPPLLKLKLGARVMLIMNLVQGRFVNGSIGVVTGFMTVAAAQEQGILVSTPSISKSAVRAGEERQRDHLYTLLLDDDRQWPLVDFNGHKMVCVPRVFTALDEEDETLIAKRVQVPLILAWALTIHKSQGQTLSRLRVHVKNAFDFGQVYVALSRATSLQTLEIVNFDCTRIIVHPAVVKWMKTHAPRPIVPLNPRRAHAAGAPRADAPPAARQAIPPPTHLVIKPEPREHLLPVKPEPIEHLLPVKPEPLEHLPLVKLEREVPPPAVKTEPVEAPQSVEPVPLVKPEPQEDGIRPLKPDPDGDDDDSVDDGSDGDPLSQLDDGGSGEGYTTEDEMWVQCEKQESVLEEPPASRKRKAPPDSDTDTDEEYYWAHSQDMSGYLDDVP